MKESEIYLDYQATTPCDPEVVQAMLPFLTGEFANSSSPHQAGNRARRAIAEARENLAVLIGALPSEIVFTSGATESNNLAILGVAAGSGTVRNTIITTAIEHKSVLAPCEWLNSNEYKVILCPIHQDGTVDLAALADLLTEETLLVSIQVVNNEIPTIQPLRQISQLAHRVGALVHTDAAQAVGRIPTDVLDLGCDLMSISGHKFYGPKGIGALFVNPETADCSVKPITFGGGQEGGLRPGTLNTASIVGLGMAAYLASEGLDTEHERSRALRDKLEGYLLSGIPGSFMNGALNSRAPHATSITIPGVDADALCANLPHIAISSASACTVGTPEPSHVLRAIGHSDDLAYQTVRLALGRFSTESEVEASAHQIVVACSMLRAMRGDTSPTYT
jgi:cysteine desulfurase